MTHLVTAFAIFLATTAVMPPTLPWSGVSRSLVVKAGEPWITPAETAGFRITPSYDETTAWLQRLVKASPQLRMVSIGKSPEGRDIWLVIASRERNFTPDALKKSGKPTVLAQAGIHSGEIDGKDAGMMLLRDMTVRSTRRDLLDKANFLFVPIFNVDGHERTSLYSRINQRGPDNAGWRTNARNLNLNRDYTKVDTEEMRGMLRTLDRWDPDLYLDLHVTDGADYQYDVTFGGNPEWAWSPASGRWLEQSFRPAVNEALRSAGHIPGPLVFTLEGDDVSKGISHGVAPARFSQGYGDARHIPSLLIENHSLKPYEQRVLGTYVFLEAALRTVGANAAALHQAIAADRSTRPQVLPLSWRAPEKWNDTTEFLGVESRRTLSPISGDVKTEWLGRPATMRIPLQVQNEVESSVKMPAAWWVPAAWREVIDLLDTHGIRYERINAPREVDVEMYRLRDAKFEADQFEAHVRVTATPVPETRRERFPAGSIRVPADQPLGILAAILLEPASEDSLFQWGFFDPVLKTTEYVEGYVMEPTAQQMMVNDPKLAEEFRSAIAADAALRSDPQARLYWFYKRTPYYDPRAQLYPVGRELP